MAPRSTILADRAKPCTKCNAVKPLEDFSTSGKKRDGSHKFNSWCRSCIAQKQASYHRQTWGPERLQFTQFKRSRSVRAFMTYLLGRARRRHECAVTVEDLEKLWADQFGRCALTGWQMTMKLGQGRVSTNVSIDRIDSRLGYVPGNIQLTCRCANIAKSDLSADEFRRMCAAVAERSDEEAQDTSLAA